MLQTTTIAALDDATRQATAFDSFRELTRACATGWAPTLKPNGGYAAGLLVGELRRRGYRVWTGE